MSSFYRHLPDTMKIIKEERCVVTLYSQSVGLRLSRISFLDRASLAVLFVPEFHIPGSARLLVIPDECLNNWVVTVDAVNN
jgi:hypothetical protein